MDGMGYEPTRIEWNVGMSVNGFDRCASEGGCFYVLLGANFIPKTARHWHANGYPPVN